MPQRNFWRSFGGAIWVLGFLAGPAQAQDTDRVYRIQADGLACPFCAYGIEKQLSAVEGVESVETDIKSGSVMVTMKTGAALDEATAAEAVERAGFTMRGFKQDGTDG